MKMNPENITPAMAMKNTPQNLKMGGRKLLLTVCAGLVVAGMVAPAARAATGLKTLSGHVPAAVSKLAAKGDLAATTNVSLALGLPLQHREALTNLLAQIYDPASPYYHRFLSPEQFAEQFGPSEQDYAAVADFARANGLTVTGRHSNRMLLEVTGNPASIRKAFHVNLRTYKHPTENRDFFAPDAEPTVSAALPIQDISGLSDYGRPQPHYRVKSSVASSGGVVSKASVKPAATTGSGPSGNYIGNDFRNAYVPGTTLDGSGQAIALVQFDGYLSNDIAAYESLAGRPNIPLQNVLIDRFNGFPTGNGGEVEVSLDIEMLVSMAPGLSKIIVYEGNPYNFHPNNVLNRIATDNAARQISCSWGWTGGPTATTDQIFQQMALQGQTFFTSSGDSDAYPAGTVDSPFGFGTPADSPYVTSVGGTTLTMNGAGASYSSETVWNWGVRYGADGIGSSGGYSSSYYSIPAWQTNINMAARGGSQTARNFPDVALTADDVLVIADGGVQYTGVGGTSVAAPLWAGFMSLVNQQATNNGLAPIGLLNPAIYKIASSAAYANCFHDTTTGNNTWSGSPNLFYATNNYDLATGLGTPNGTNLINALASVGVTNPITHISPPPAPYGTTLASLNGSNPNGNWELFVLDDAQFNTGVISNGWSVTLTLASPVGYSANLELLMNASSASIAVSNNLTYTLAVTNYGPSTSSNVLVLDNLPTGVTVISTGGAVHSGSTLTWNVGTLAVNAGVQLSFTVRPDSLGTIFNYATVSADTSDANTDDNFASVQTLVTVATRPQLSAALRGGSGAFQFAVTSDPGVTNIIQASTNLVNWDPIYTNIGSFTFTNLTATNYPQRFYRSVVGQ
jgi:uncharacterized repeat protein (TIGR01451 family)